MFKSAHHCKYSLAVLTDAALRTTVLAIRSPLPTGNSKGLPTNSKSLPQQDESRQRNNWVGGGQQGVKKFVGILLQDGGESGKMKARAKVKDISKQVLVKGIKQWAVYEEKSGSRTIRTVFKIT